MKYTWLVEKYLEGDLSGEELRNFELEILKKPDVAREVERIRAMNRFMLEQHNKMSGESGLIEDFDDIENVLSADEISRQLEDLKVRKISSSKSGLSNFKTRLAESQARESLQKLQSNKVLVRKFSLGMAALTLIVLVSITTLVLIGSSTPNYDRLYTSYFEAPGADVQRSTGLPQDSYNLALDAYNSGNFASALEYFNQIPEEGASSEYFFYKALTSMELGLYTQAILHWNRFDSDIVWNQESMWYKSLCYLKMEDLISTRASLEEIIISDGYYKARASNLLRKL